jgi:multidrug transporter EmrE-like cation transporter
MFGFLKNLREEALPLAGETMKSLTIILIIAVSVMNVALNLSLKRTAGTGDTLSQTIMSGGFAACLLIGLLSFSSLFALYSTGITLSRGILMMGAVSILGGSLYGVFLYNEKLHPSEWLIFSLLAALLAYRWFFKS